MSARIVYAVAALLLLASIVGVRRATWDVARYGAVLPGGIPAVVYEPGPQRMFGERPPEQKLPVVVLAHGFASSKSMMSALARQLARAGYAVITFDFRGHGQNPAPFERDFAGGSDGLHDDLAAAVLYARTSPRFDGERLALAGHSMGAAAIVRYAAREPNATAVVAISGGGFPEGPYAPPNLFLVWAAGDFQPTRERGREIAAKRAGVERVVLDRTYGDSARGEAVRASEVDGVNHLSILYSAEAARRIADWLAPLLLPEAAAQNETRDDPRMLWSRLGIAALLVLLWGLPQALAPAIPRQLLPAISAPLRRLGVLVVASLASLALLSMGDPFAGSDPARFLPLLGARDLAAFFATTGALVALWLARRGELSIRGLLEARTFGAAAVLVGFVYLVLGGLSLPLWDSWLPPHRLGPALLSFLLALPFFAALEFLLRGPGVTGVWLPIAGKLVTLAALVGGAAAGLLSFTVLIATSTFAAQLVLFELLAYRLSRVAPNLWVASLVQAALAAWTLAATFPVDG